MKKQCLLLVLTAIPAVSVAQLSGPRAPDSLSFQGYLTDTTGIPIDGPTNMTFKLYRGPSEVWSQTHNGVPVSDGVFSVILGGTGPASLNTVAFGEPIDVGIAIGGGAEITPRTPLTSAPFALGMRGMYALDAKNGVLEAPNLIGGAPNNHIADDVVGATISGGGGITSDLFGSPLSRPDSVLESWGTISGGLGNTAGGFASAVGGGRSNKARGGASTVGGGSSNVAASDFTFVGGGTSNSASGSYAVITGGNDNSAANQNAVVAGGANNRARGPSSSVGGGFNNAALAGVSTVPGGEQNEARGYASMAAGFRARSNHEGSFVWSDRSKLSLLDTISTSAPNQFIIRAAGGVGIGTGKPKRGLTLSRTSQEAAYQLELRNVGNITIPNFDGIAFTQADSGVTNLASIKVLYRNNGNPDMSLSLRSAADLVFLANDAQVGIGTTSPTEKLEVNGNVLANNVVVPSDRRLKRNIQPISDALTLATRLQGVSYEWRIDEYPDRGLEDGQHLGFIAQDVESILPEAVRVGTDGTYTMRYQEVIPVLLEAVKELSTKVDEQSARLAELEARMTN